MKKLLFISLFSLNFALFSQNIDVENGFSVQKKDLKQSHIVKLNASSFEKVVVKNAIYDASRQNLPYYLSHFKTSLNSIATPALKIKSTILLDNTTAQIVKNAFSKYLTADFQLKHRSGISGKYLQNTCEIVPFKVTDNGEVYELTDYEIDWQTQPNLTLRKSNISAFKSNSVLASGKWYKMAITTDGVYKLDAAFFANAGISIGNINPKNIRIYGNGGVILPERNSDFRYDDLEENAIQVIGESDNVFNSDDYVLFYGKGTTRWTKKAPGKGTIFTGYRNYFSDTSFYYITFDLGAGKRITSQSSLSSPNISTSTYDYYNHHEIDNINFVKSGRNMYGEYMDVTTSYNFTFNDNNFIQNDTIRVEATFAGRGTVDNTYRLSANGLVLDITCPGIDITNYLSDYASIKFDEKKSLNTNSSAINVNVSKLTSNTVGWLDKFSINARRELTFNGSTFNFRDSRISGTGNICNYNLNANGFSNIAIWNVSDIINPYNQAYSTSGNALSFNANADSLNEYVMFTYANLPKPIYYGTVANQNLHALQQADYIIVAPNEFIPYANRLASLHQQKEGLTTVVVTTSQIYNEFSSGKIDAAAIRDFTRMLYTRGDAINKPTKYLLLFGRGSYYNRNGKVGNTNLIPTYETENSVSYIYSVASDDFFTLMDPNEGYLAESSGFMDIGVGRIVSSNITQANDVVNKIENYYRTGSLPSETTNNCATGTTNQIFGDWRNYLLFCADDGDGALHMTQADNLSNKVKLASSSYNIDKVYIDAYKGLSTPGGKRYPDMQAAFNDRINKGCLIMNYTGHGGEVGLSAERVVDIPTINSWKNFNSLPLFITATCEFSRYDDPDRVSAGEMCLTNPAGGSIAMLTTCRLAFSNFNETLNNRLFDYVFKKQDNGKMPALGDIIRNTKDYLGQNFFYSNFHLLGDPALTLAYPKYKVYTTNINGKNITVSSKDTIRGLSKVTVKGYVGDTLGNKLSSFNGLVYPVVFDKKELITCQLNDAGSSVTPGTLTPFQFISQQNIIYKGKSEVKNGEFTYSFMVPKDVSFNYGNAKFSYYATDGNTDANGNYDSVKVGGLDPNGIVDNEGPQINLYLNSKSFVNGGVTNESPILLADIIDSSGVNTVGTGFGHDITAVLDGNTNKPFILNDSYESNLNSYQGGKVKYQLSELSEGSHNLSLKVWDVQNNSSTTTTDFIVSKNADLALNMVLNYPNPFTTRTSFFFEHNRNCEDLHVTIQIFTISGKIAKTIRTTINCEGFRNDGIVWDGRDDYGDKLGKGVYLYKIAVTDKDQKKAEKIEKLVILN
ncbi:MAG: type IX secretion system sortase PorU [Sphingobacteriaceae bacterium]